MRHLIAGAIVAGLISYGLTQWLPTFFMRTYDLSQSQTGMLIAGVFGMATWGGNRDDIGWKLVGMDGPPHAWAPPFGHYDTGYMEEQKNGE